MTDRAFSTIAGRVEAIATKAPRPVVLEHIRFAARKACEQTLGWRYMIPLFDLLPGVHEYAFNTPSNAEVEHIFGVLVNGSPLDLLTLDDAIFQYPQWADLFSGEDADVVWSETPGGYLGAGEYNSDVFNPGSTFVLPAAIVADASQPRACCMLGPKRYIILPLPDGATTYTTRMIVAMKPTRDATDMDSDVFDELEDAILHRALETLLTMKDKPWTDGTLAMYHAEEYRKARLEKKARNNLGHVRGSMSVRMQRWA